MHPLKIPNNDAKTQYKKLVINEKCLIYYITLFTTEDSDVIERGETE